MSRLRRRRLATPAISAASALLLAAALSFPAPGAISAPGQEPPRTSVSLDGPWLFQRDGAPANEWKTVTVPSSFQSHEGTNFHGVGWYRKALDPLQVPEGKRLLLHFQAAATEAEVWWNGERLGTHLGGWTPFRFDVTALARKSPSGSHEIRVRLDEKVGHNTQGFLPIIAPHFGGLWQGVSLVTVPVTHIDDLGLMAIGEAATGALRLEVPLGGDPGSLVDLRVGVRLRGTEEWLRLPTEIEKSSNVFRASVTVPGAKLWSPEAPHLYEVELALPGARGDRITTRAAFRSVAAFGPELRLNGQPLSVRGLLNWGYSAPLVDPNPGEAVWRGELEFAKANGFNLMKFCLWVPPKRYLELADEMGLLTWMEYPTWHPSLTEKFLGPLQQEFREFFLYDRNHPSVILRSLTCETGASAELTVIQDLYDTAHRLIPGALVEDDSSWIGWNRIHDFYDDHPYGNNHTWITTLAGFSEHILAHGIKPLVLGESIAADTWVDKSAALERLGDERPWWAPAVLDDMARWSYRLQASAGPGGITELRADSLRYAMLMRKYQIETYRREIPYGGYVITVLRDIPNCSMGLIDYENRPKWSPDQWGWHGETLLLLKTENDRRAFSSAEPVQGQLLLSHFGAQPFAEATLTLSLESADGKVLENLTRTNIDQKCGTLAKLADFDWPVSSRDLTLPHHLLIRAALSTRFGHYTNSWPIWLVPEVKDFADRVQVHSNASKAARGLLASCPAFVGVPPGDEDSVTVVASSFDPDLARYLESGGRVLLLPDGQPHSFALSSHWFLRGAPYFSTNAFGQGIPRDLLVELQHFDLASRVVPDLPHLDSFDPVLLLWDTHDSQQVKTHGLVFRTKVGKGRLLVSALRHDGTDNPAGRWLLDLFVNHLHSAAWPRHQLSAEVWQYAKARMQADQTNLANRTWRFKPDPQNSGLEQGWHKAALTDETGWGDIRIGSRWESQGYAALDFWAWYRLSVEIPQGWADRKVFLSFEGVDDCYEVYVNGELAGRGGDLETRRDALGERKSHEITRLVRPGANATIAVRVHDWYGAGGIFRPVTLGTVPLKPGLDLLR